MVTKHTKQTEISELARQKSGYQKIRVLPRPNTPKNGFCQVRADQNTAINQTEQTETKFEPEQTDRNMGTNQTK